MVNKIYNVLITPIRYNNLFAPRIWSPHDSQNQLSNMEIIYIKLDYKLYYIYTHPRSIIDSFIEHICATGVCVYICSDSQSENKYIMPYNTIIYMYV